MLITGILFIIVFILFSVFILKKIIFEKNKNLLFVLLIFAGFLRIYTSIYFDLHNWDEQYHALISKHIFNTIFIPKLYPDYLIEFDHRDWTHNEVWLSKPFLPFLIIGGSIKAFGLNLISVRLPSVLFGIGAVWIIFQIAKNLFNRRVAFFSGFLYSINGLVLELSGGKISSDHVDNLFQFLTLSSILLFIQNLEKQKASHSLLIGFIIAMAFFTKWTFIGVLVVPFIIYSVHKKLPAKTYFLIATPTVILLPVYFIYLYSRFPNETNFIVSELVRLIHEPDETHNGNYLFYINKVRMTFGELIYIPYVGMIYFYLRHKKSNVFLLLLWTFIPLIIFSICATKRVTYLLMISAPSLIICSAFIDILLHNYSKNRCFGLLIILLLALPIRYSIERLKPFEKRTPLCSWKTQIESLIQKETNKKLVIYNEPNYIKAMFHYEIIAYDRSLTQSQRDEIKLKGYTLYKLERGNYIKK